MTFVNVERLPFEFTPRQQSAQAMDHFTRPLIVCNDVYQDRAHLIQLR